MIDHKSERGWFNASRHALWSRAVVKWVLVLAIFLLPALVQAEVSLKIIKVANEDTVASGETITYRIQYTVASTTENALNAVITDILPVELSSSASDITLEGDDFVTSAIYTAATRTAQFVFESPLAAGTTGTILVKARFPRGTTLDGTISENIATFTADNGDTVVSPPATVTSTATFRMTPVKDRSAGGALDQATTYRLRLRNPSPNVGGLDLLNTVIVDNLPAGAVFVSATNGGVYDSTAHTVTWNLGTVAVGSSSTTYPAEVRVTVIFPSAIFESGQSILNQMYFSGTPRGGEPVSGSTTVTNTLTSASAGLNLSKSNTTASNLAPIGSSYLYRLNISNSGYFPLDSVAIADDVPPLLEVTSLQARGEVWYQTNLNSAWTRYGTDVYSSLTTIPVASLGLAAGEYLTAVRYYLGTIPYPFTGWSTSAQPGYTATVLTVDRSGNTIVPGNAIVNTASLFYKYETSSYNKTAKIPFWSMTEIHGRGSKKAIPRLLPINPARRRPMNSTCATCCRPSIRSRIRSSPTSSKPI